MEAYKTAYAEGFNAAENGVKPECCPYPEDHKYRVWWSTGYSRFYSDRLRNSPVPYDVYYH